MSPWASMSKKDSAMRAASVVKITSVPLYTTSKEQLRWYKYGKSLFPVRTCEVRHEM